MKILVVDDHSLITDALSVLFLDLDPTAEVITTRTAEGALKIQEEQPELDLVVLDLGMPGVSGTALLEAMVAVIAGDVAPILGENRAIARLGNEAINTLISSTIVHSSTPCSYRSRSNWCVVAS